MSTVSTAAEQRVAPSRSPIVAVGCGRIRGGRLISLDPARPGTKRSDVSAEETGVGEAEDVGECERHGGTFAEHAEDLDGEQRMSADFEEVVVALNCPAKNVRPDLDDGRLVCS